MYRILICTFLLTVSAQAQFQDLVTTGDGSRLYFSTELRQTGTPENLYPKVFQLDTSGTWLVAERDPGEPVGNTTRNFYQLTSPDVSADGAVVAFTASRPCTGGSSCLAVERYQGTIRLLYTGAEMTYSGHVNISHNGRFAVTWGESAWYPTPGTDLIDLSTGEKTRLPYSVADSGRRRIADDGTIVLSDGKQLFLWRKSEVQALQNSQPSSTAMINDGGTMVLYVSADTQHKLIAYDVATGNEIEIAGSSGPLLPSMTGDGSEVLYLASSGLHLQAFLIHSDGTGLRQLTDDPEGITAAVLSGNGQVAYAVTGIGRLLKIDVPSGNIEYLITRTPHISSVGPGVAPGTLMSITGTGLAEVTETGTSPLPTSLGGVQVKFGGVPQPLLYVSPTVIFWQVRWDMLDGATPFELVSGHSSFHTGPDVLTVQSTNPRFYLSTEGTQNQTLSVVAAHSQFEALVSSTNPARPDEVIHLYMSGLGAVTPPLPSGVPAPLQPLSWIQAPLTCQFWDGSPHDSHIYYDGLAPEMIGIYQVSLRVPEGLRTTPATLACSTSQPSGGSSAAIGSIPVQVSGAPQP